MSRERLVDGAWSAEGAMAVISRLSALGGALRDRGVRLGVGELLIAHRALDAIDATSRQDAFWALRAALCSSAEDFVVFGEAFRAVFGEADEGDAPVEAESDQQLTLLAPPATANKADPDEDRDLSEETIGAAWSDVEVLRAKDFGAYTDAERAAARRLFARLAARGPWRISRRTRPTRRRTEHFDPRATLRTSLHFGGEPVERRFRVPTKRPRRLVLVCDVSGSMEPYSRVLLQYLQASVTARTRVEAFVFGTRLTRVTQDLAGRDPDRALRRATERVIDWSGGTRIGASLAQLNRQHGRQLGRGAVVAICSDGWDRGEPAELAAQMARLRRCAHRVVWLNPLAASPRYEPLTRGMQAALPHIDLLLPGNSIASLEAMADAIEAGW